MFVCLGQQMEKVKMFSSGASNLCIFSISYNIYNTVWITAQNTLSSKTALELVETTQSRTA